MIFQNISNILKQSVSIKIQEIPQTFLLIQYNMNHNIQTANFSSSDEDDEISFMPTPDMMNQYNREYSAIVKEVEKFLKESTDCVKRFVAFHNYGVSFNLAQLLTNLTCMENSFKTKLALTESSQEKNPKQLSKHKYEVSFNRLLQRMGDIFNDLIDCELEFKKKYFGINNLQQSHRSQQRMRSSRSPVNYSVSSVTKSSKSEKMKFMDYLENEEREEKREAELRATLNQTLKPKPTAIQTECKLDYSTTENLYRLNQKIDQFIGDIKGTRSRQQKLIELFNLNRVKKIHNLVQQPTMCFTPPSNISMISPKAEEQIEGEEEMESFLESFRSIRKNSDSFTQNGHSGRRFFKKRRERQ